MVTPVGADFSPGDIVGNTYEVIGYIGRGAMGYVYHVRHVGLPKEYALKTLSTDQITEKAWLRFQIEAQSIAKMFNPNIITIHNFAVHKAANRPEQPFYVMDLLAGRSLMEELRDNDPLPVARALPVFIQAASGIGYAHGKGIIHRDVKPGNVMLLEKSDASGATVKIVDFGIAKLTADSDLAQQHLTSAGEVFGSPYYMSPEQGLGQTVDARSDIYSLGVTFFEALTGDAPFTASSAVDIMLLHQNAPVPQLNEVVEGGDFPPTVQIVIERMMAKDPIQRYQNMQDVVADLAAIQFGNPLPSLAIAQKPLQRKSVESAGEADLGSSFDGEESTNSDVWAPSNDNVDQFESDEDDEDRDEADENYEIDGDSQYDLEPLAEPGSSEDLDDQLGSTSDSNPDSDRIPSAQVRALTTIPIRSGLPKGQIVFLAVSVATVVISGATFIALKSAGSQASLKPAAGLTATKQVASATIGIKNAAGGKVHASSGNAKEQPKLDPEEDKEPGPSRDSTKPFGTVRYVKNGKMVDFKFPTDVYIGKICWWDGLTKKNGEAKAQGRLHFGPDTWLKFRATRIVGKYPQYLKRFGPDQISAVELVENSDSDDILKACTVIPGIDELIVENCKKLTSKSIPSLSMFTGLRKFNSDHSNLDGISLAQATCWKNLTEFKASHCRNVTPILLKLKESKDLYYIDVHESNLTYQDYKAISEISSLTWLKFEEDPMTLNELKLLAKLPKLDTIELWDCGLDESAIPVLRQFKTLKTLKFGSEKTRIALRDYFRKCLPGLKVE